VREILGEDHVAAKGTGRREDRCIPVRQAVTLADGNRVAHHRRSRILNGEAQESLDKAGSLGVAEAIGARCPRGLDEKLLQYLHRQRQVRRVQQSEGSMGLPVLGGWMRQYQRIGRRLAVPP